MSGIGEPLSFNGENVAQSRYRETHFVFILQIVEFIYMIYAHVGRCDWRLACESQDDCNGASPSYFDPGMGTQILLN